MEASEARHQVKVARGWTREEPVAMQYVIPGWKFDGWKFDNKWPSPVR